MGIFYILFLLVLLVFILGTLVYFWTNTDKYVENLQSIRKTYYVLFVLAVTIGLLIEEIKMDDWQMLLQLASLFVFIDLAVFQTPDILKIWNTEFQHSNYIRKTIKKNEEVLGYNAKKVNNFTEVILKTVNHFEQIDQPTTWEAYRDEMKKYLNLYADTFQFHISFFPFDSTSDAEELKANLGQAFGKVEMCYNKELTDTEWRESQIQELLNGKSRLLKQKEEDKKETTSNDIKQKVFIVAYYGASYNMLIGLNSNMVDVDGIDASHILNLAQIFDWYMV
jgi:hypothetical protein